MNCYSLNVMFVSHLSLVEKGPLNTGISDHSQCTEIFTIQNGMQHYMWGRNVSDVMTKVDNN